MACRISELVIDARDPGRLASFWCEVLGFVELEQVDGSIEIGPPDTGFGGPQPTIVFEPSPEPKAGKLRLHIDVSPTDRDQDAELTRLLAAGARPADIGQRGDEGWHVLSDPEGNEFCLLRTRLRPASALTAAVPTLCSKSSRRWPNQLADRRHVRYYVRNHSFRTDHAVCTSNRLPKAPSETRTRPARLRITPRAAPRTGRLVPSGAEWPVWMDEPGYLAAQCADDPGDGDVEEYEDPDNAPPRGMDDAQLAALIAGAGEFTADQEAAEAEMARAGLAGVRAALGSVAAGRRGPGMPGSASRFPGECTSRASGFASGKPLDVAPGGPVLAQFAAEAAGDGDRYGGVSDDELVGVICGWDRVEANASARKHAAVAELLRRRPVPGTAPVDGASGLPGEWDEFVSRELGAALALSAGDAEEVLAVAAALEVSLPGTRAAFRSGVLTGDKALIIAGATMLLDPGRGAGGGGDGPGSGRFFDCGGVAVGDQPGGDAGEPGEGA